MQPTSRDAAGQDVMDEQGGQNAAGISGKSAAISGSIQARSMRSGRPRRFAVLTAVALAGGTMFGTCQARIRDSVVNGTQLFILNLFDPANVVITDEHGRRSIRSDRDVGFPITPRRERATGLGSLARRSTLGWCSAPGCRRLCWLGDNTRDGLHLSCRDYVAL
jgi:hypothetical protein